MPATWNLFSIGRKRRNEDQLTEMLVWLIDAVPEVGRAIATLAFNGLSLDGEIKVTTQHGVAKGRLDALFVSPAFALVVESKIDSGFGDDQIARYLDWLSAAHAHRARRGLMTLTAHPTPWGEVDEKRAEAIGVVASAHLWEELHDVLEPVAAEADRDVLSARLIHEFLDMLGQEGLIPMKPLMPEEYAKWPDAWRAVRRFHEYFLDCREAIGAALGAKATSKSTSEGYIWQDYLYDDGCKIVIGLNCSDDRALRNIARDVPIVWMAVEAKHWPDWPAAADRLDAARPEGWHAWDRWWGERPQVWRHLDDVLGDGTFEEQRQRLAQACSVGTSWLAGARTQT
jgi:hypothetical protein